MEGISEGKVVLLPGQHPSGPLSSSIPCQFVPFRCGHHNVLPPSTRGDAGAASQELFVFSVGKSMGRGGGRGAGKGGREAWGEKSTKDMTMTSLSALSAMSTAQASGVGARLTTTARSILSSKPESGSPFSHGRRSLVSPADQLAERSLERSRRSIAIARKMQMSAGACPYIVVSTSMQGYELKNIDWSVRQGKAGASSESIHM